MVENMNIINSKSPKFTRGEKCIFTHLVITFSFILGVLFIYLAHLYLVNHSLTGVFIIRRPFAGEKAHHKEENLPIGLIFLNIKPVLNICNTVLLTPQWSVGPGHCIVMRSDPDLSYLMTAWRLKYMYNMDTIIKRSVVHPHFNRITFANNIGLVQHVYIRGVAGYDNKLNNNILNIMKLDDIVIGSWNFDTIQEGKYPLLYPVRLMEAEQCRSYLDPITEIRSYEFCVVFKKKINTLLGHGAAILNQDNQVFGFSTWGENDQRSLPITVLNLTNFNEWLEIIYL